MHWLILIVAGLSEVAFASCPGKARMSGGMAMWWWYAGFVFSMLISMALLIRATQAIPIGTAYAVWTGIGAAGTALLGILVLGEPAGFLRLFFLFMLIVGIVGLKAVSPV